MNEQLAFTSWQRSAIYDLVPDGRLEAGRLVGKLELTLHDTRGPDVATGSVPFHIASARDVASLAARAIKRTAPAALAHDVETTKLVHVDFNEPDFPWRYTPRKAAGDVLAPWLVLLVGTSAELSIVGAQVKVGEPGVLRDHPLDQSHRWAHLQDDGTTRLSRIVSPRRLAPQTEYLAVLVPAYDDAGAPAWDLPAGRQPAALAMLHAWRFWTGEAGDFETLAFAILPRSVPGLGRAPLAYRRSALDAALEVQGAITGLGARLDGPAEAAARADVQAFKAAVDALAATEPLGREVVGMPTYGRPWIGEAADAAWSRALNADPRDRGVAGLGLWMGRDAQQELVDACVTQLGAIGLATHLVGQLAFGIALAGSLWSRRLPAEPVRQLHLLAPLMRRLAATNGTAMDAMTGPASPLVSALFSTAARRMLRRGSAQTRHTVAGFIGRRELIDAANVCPIDDGRAPVGLPDGDALARALDLPRIRDRQAMGQRRDPPHGTIRVDPSDLLNAIDAWPLAERRRCVAPDLARIAAVVTAAVDPRGANAPSVRRVRSRIGGLDLGTLVPPRVPVGLDFATWSLLRDRAKEWLLPGIGRLPKDSVVAMQTNPRFIDGYLVGLNTQLLGELHWRGLAVDPRSTPLKMFWGHVDFESGRREAEIRAIVDWGATTELGALQHQVLHPGDSGGKRDLVIVFRTDLFRRYPHTVVYLAKPVPDADTALKATPDFAFTAATRGNRVHLGPIFQGAIERDVVFFAFDVDPDTLDKYWLVLDEPPSELRFRGVASNGTPHAGTTPVANGVPAAAADPHAAAFAQRLIDRPTRVAIDGAHLESLGLRL